MADFQGPLADFRRLGAAPTSTCGLLPCHGGRMRSRPGLNRRSTGENKIFRAAREAAGCPTTTVLAKRLAEFAAQYGYDEHAGSRQIRRWEAGEATPTRSARLVLAFFGVQSLADLGFPPSGDGDGPDRRQSDRPLPSPAAAPLRRPRATRPAATAVEFHAITVAYRQLYQRVDPEQLHPPVTAHVRFGESLLGETHGPVQHDLAVSLAEVGLLAGRIEFFDLGQPSAAAESFRRALDAAAVADDLLLGAAILGHCAFIPGWAGDRDRYGARMRAARTYARRADAPEGFSAWLDAVEAECETHCRRARHALTLIHSAGDRLAADPDPRRWPDWFCWFSPGQLASFRGNVELQLGHLHQARATLSAALEHFETSGSTKQRAVILGDLAAVAAAQQDPDAASAYLIDALDLLETASYQAALDRILAVREQLDPWAGTPVVRTLDDHLYGWRATLSGLR